VVKKLFSHVDFLMLFTALTLPLLGVVMVYSASMVSGVVLYDVPPDYFLRKQFYAWVVGSVLMIFATSFPYHLYKKFVKLMILGTVFLLLAVLVYGRTSNNAQSWIDLGIISFQPAEIAKISIIIYLASIYTKKQHYIDDLYKGMLPPVILTIMITSLIIIQPDLGSALIILSVAAFIIIASGLKKTHLIFLVTAGAITMICFYFFGLSGEQLSRFEAAYEPFKSPDDDGYQLIQSFIAINGGGLIGLGLGGSIQKLGYLPEAHTDFIMAIIAEELGFFGVCLTLSMILIIVLRGLHISRYCRDPFGSLMAIGFSSLIGIQAFINLGGMTGILPLTGVPLPFVSFGGTSLVLFMFSVGVMLNIFKVENLSYRPKKAAPNPSQSYHRENRKAF